MEPETTREAEDGHGNLVKVKLRPAFTIHTRLDSGIRHVWTCNICPPTRLEAQGTGDSRQGAEELAAAHYWAVHYPVSG